MSFKSIYYLNGLKILNTIKRVRMKFIVGTYYLGKKIGKKLVDNDEELEVLKTINDLRN